MLCHNRLPKQLKLCGKSRASKVSTPVLLDFNPSFSSYHVLGIHYRARRSRDSVMGSFSSHILFLLYVFDA